MGIVLQKLDSFFRTQVTLEPSDPLNSATNLLFRPLQHLIGQNKYKCLQGKIDHIPHQKSPAGALFYFSTLYKVAIWVGAFLAACVLTWFGIVTRGLSFLSPDVDRAYTLAFLLQLPDKLFYSLMPDQFPKDLYESAREMRMKMSIDPSARPPDSLLGDDEISPPNLAPTLEKSAEAQTTTPSSKQTFTTPSAPPQPEIPQTREILFPEEPPQVPTIEKTPEKTAEPISLDFMQFISELADVLTTPDIDSATIERWINTERSKEDYQYHFFMAEIHLHNLYMADDPSYNGTKHVYEMTVNRLKTFGLERYLNEVPSPERLESLKTTLADKPLVISFTQICLSVLRPLAKELLQLTGSKEENQKTIQAWFVKTKNETGSKYCNPFFFAPYVLLRSNQGLLTAILEEGTLQELSDLYTACRTRLLAHDLKEYVEEKTSKPDLSAEFEQAIQNPSEASLQPTAANPTPAQSLVVDYMKVDDDQFKKIILELLPNMKDCFKNQNMFRYWKNSLLDRAIYFCISRYNICQKVQTFKTKVEVAAYLKALKSHLLVSDPLTILSQGYVTVIDRLVPLLPSNFIDNWRSEYTKCCRFLEQLSATEYFTGKALPFLGDDSIFEQQLKDEMKETLKLFKRLEKVPDEQFLKKFQNDELIKKCKGRPFWFARELKDLCRGYGVSFMKKENKEFERLLTSITERLKRLKLERLLQEDAPLRNFHTLRMLGVADDIIEKIKTMN